MTADRISFEDDGPRPVTNPASPSEFDELYDVSPPSSPQLSPQRPSTTVNQIPRRPVGAPPGSSNRSVSAPASNPTMLATLQQPASPIPQPNTLENVDCCIRDWEGTDPGRVSPIDEVAPAPTREAPVPKEVMRSQQEPDVNRAKSRPLSLLKDVPARPDDSHHLASGPPVQPAFFRQDSLESQPSPLPRRSETVPVERTPSKDMEPLTISKRSETAPIAPTRNAPPPPPASTSMVMPSPDQLARLNSRKGRPTGLTDPRRASGGSNQRPSSGSHSRNASGGSMQSLNMHNTPPRLTPEQAFRSIPPRAAVGAYGSTPPAPRPNQAHVQLQQANSYAPISNRRQSNGQLHGRNTSSSSPGLRPPMQRLETIHSQTSSIGPAEPSPYLIQKTVMVSRQASRAERSAAKNIKDAKKKGWRSSTRNEKKKDRDGASSAGWTDVSRETGYTEREKKEKAGKCVVM